MKYFFWLLFLKGILLSSSACFAQFKADNVVPVANLITKYSKIQFQSGFQNKIPTKVELVALGEVSHGGYEPIAFKANMVKYLIEEQGYRTILFEASDLYIMSLARAYINGLGMDDTAFGNKVKSGDFPKAYSAVYIDLFRWLKDYNLAHSMDKVQVIGFEVGGSQAISDLILTKYIIPFDYKNSLPYIYKFNSDTNDLEKITLIAKWFSANKQSLQIKLAPTDYHLLEFYIKNALNAVDYQGMEKKNQSQIETSNLFRDSVLSENVLSLRGKTKTIVWAHNAHAIRSAYKQMGNRLAKFLGNKYFVIVTDFSKAAAVEITDSDLWSGKKIEYSTRVFNAAPSTAAARLYREYGLSEGVFFRQTLLDMKVGLDTNLIDVKGQQAVLPTLQNPFDTLVVFKYIFPDAGTK